MSIEPPQRGCGLPVNDRHYARRTTSQRTAKTVWSRHPISEHSQSPSACLKGAKKQHWTVTPQLNEAANLGGLSFGHFGYERRDRPAAVSSVSNRMRKSVAGAASGLERPPQAQTQNCA